MLAIASKIILCLVLAALLGLIIGYLLGKMNCPRDKYKSLTPDDPHTEDDGDCGDSSKEKKESNGVKKGSSSKALEPQSLMSSQDPALREESTAKPAKRSTPKSAKTAPSNDKKRAIKPKPKDDEPVDAYMPSDSDKPASLLSAPRGGKKDNLTRIKGIGIKIDKLLNDTGVYHFDQIASWSEKEANWIDHAISFPGRAKRENWVGQAKLLAKGKETEFSKRVDAGEVPSSKKS